MYVYIYTHTNSPGPKYMKKTPKNLCNHRWSPVLSDIFSTLSPSSLPLHGFGRKGMEQGGNFRVETRHRFVSSASQTQLGNGVRC